MTSSSFVHISAPSSLTRLAERRWAAQRASTSPRDNRSRYAQRRSRAFSPAPMRPAFRCRRAPFLGTRTSSECVLEMERHLLAAAPGIGSGRGVHWRPRYNAGALQPRATVLRASYQDLIVL